MNNYRRRSCGKRKKQVVSTQGQMSSVTLRARTSSASIVPSTSSQKNVIIKSYTFSAWTYTYTTYDDGSSERSSGSYTSGQGEIMINFNQNGSTGVVTLWGYHWFHWGSFTSEKITLSSSISSYNVSDAAFSKSGTITVSLGYYNTSGVAQTATLTINCTLTKSDASSSTVTLSSTA